MREKIYKIIFDIDCGKHVEYDQKRSEAATKIESLLMIACEEQKRICVERFNNIPVENWDHEVELDAILNAPLPFTLPDNKIVLDKEKLREIVLGFFFWWYNQPGNNTYQGFDKFCKEKIKDFGIDLNQ